MLQLRLAVSCCLGAKSLGAHTVGTCGGSFPAFGTKFLEWHGSCVAPPCNAVPAFAWACHATINKGLSVATINKGARGLGRERREGQEEARTWRHSERARHPARHVKRRWCAGADGHLRRGAASQQASKPSHGLAEQWERGQGKGDGGEGGTLVRKGAR